MGRFISPSLRTSGPQCLISVGWLHHDIRHSPHTYRTTASGWSIRHSTRSGTRWSTPTEIDLPDGGTDRLWSTLLSLARGVKRVLLVADCGSDLLTVSGFWARVESGQFSLRLDHDTYTDERGKRRKRRPHPLVLSGTPDLIGWSGDGTEWRCVSRTNHFAVPMVDLSRSVGIAPPSDATHDTGVPGGAGQHPQWVSDVLLRAYQRHISWWIEGGFGRWRETTGSASWSCFLASCGAKSILVHDSPGASAMERAAICGGRAQTFWFGSAGGLGSPVPAIGRPVAACPVHLESRLWKLDIRSMYGSILRDGLFPTALRQRLRAKKPKQLLACEGKEHVVATVRVRCDEPRLPYHDPDRGVCYPVGEWWTTLCSPELMPAIRDGIAVQVGEAWSYDQSRAFRPFADRLLGLREHAKSVGDRFTESCCKSLINALGGRLARTFRGWVSEPHKPCPERWGPWLEIDGDTGEVTRLRGVCGVRQRFVSKDEREPGLCVCFAALTSYGRERMRGILRDAGPRGVLWCDTDGVIVTDGGLSALRAAGHLDGSGPGRLRVVEEIPWFVGRTPKHYYDGRDWTLAGVRGDFSPIDSNRVRSYLSVNPVRSGESPTGESIPTVVRTVSIDSIPLSDRPGADGWSEPPRVSGGVLHWASDHVSTPDGHWVDD